MSADELMLTKGLKSCNWIPQFRQNDSLSRGGDNQTNEFGLPFWVLSFRYDNMQDSTYRALRGWIARRDGARVPFMAYRPSNEYPENHPSTDNSGLVLSGYNGTTGAITLNKGNLVEGDMVSWIDINSAQFVGEIATIDAVSGSSTTFKTFPFAPQPHATEDARVWRALGRFRMIPQSLNIDDRADGLYSVSFQARQMEKAYAA